MNFVFIRSLNTLYLSSGKFTFAIAHVCAASVLRRALSTTLMPYFVQLPIYVGVRMCLHKSLIHDAGMCVCVCVWGTRAQCQSNISINSQIDCGAENVCAFLFIFFFLSFYFFIYLSDMLRWHGKVIWYKMEFMYVRLLDTHTHTPTHSIHRTCIRCRKNETEREKYSRN